MGAAGSVELHALQFEIGCVGIRSTYVGSIHVRKDALRSPKEYGSCRASTARNHLGTTQGMFQGSVRGKLTFSITFSIVYKITNLRIRIPGDAQMLGTFSGSTTVLPRPEGTAD